MTVKFLEDTGKFKLFKITEGWSEGMATPFGGLETHTGDLIVQTEYGEFVLDSREAVFLFPEYFSEKEKKVYEYLKKAKRRFPPENCYYYR